MKQESQHGFTMIEVLVTIVILAIGLLGIAGVQTLSLKHSNNANIRTLVNMHAVEIVERMRGNMSAFEGGSYNNIDGTETSTTCTSCTSAQLASLDAWQWNQNLAADIPGATGTVVTAGGVATVTINWTEREQGSDAEAKSYVLRSRIVQ